MASSPRRPRPAWSPESTPRPASRPSRRDPSSPSRAPPELWRTPALRLADAEKRAASASAKGDHREALRCLLRAVALAKLHATTVAAVGGALSRAEATAAARAHVAIARVYETSRGVRLLDDDPSGETTQHAGLARAIVHLQHAIGACVPDPNLVRSRACRAALESTRLDARVRLGPMLVAVGRLEDAIETCRRGLASWDRDDEENDDDVGDDRTRTHVSDPRAPGDPRDRLALLLCASDAERLLGESASREARDAKSRSRASAAATAAERANLAPVGDPDGEAEYASRAAFAARAEETRAAHERARSSAAAEATIRFDAARARLADAETIANELGTAEAFAQLHTRARALRRATRDWRGAAEETAKLLATAEANGGGLPGTSHEADARGALRAELAELFVRARDFRAAREHAEAAVEALMEEERVPGGDEARAGGAAARRRTGDSEAIRARRRHTRASIRAMGTLGFIIARGGDLRGAAQTYRDAISAAMSSRVFGEDATSMSADVADLEAALGSVCFAASDESEETPEAKRANELESALASKNTRPTRDERDEAARARREADAAGRRRRAEAAAALEEAVGCFSRAADVARRAWGTRSVRCAELEARADAAARALDDIRREGGDVAYL